MSNTEREVAKVMSADFILSRGFIPDVSIRFDYETGGSQFLTGWFCDVVFLVKLLQAFGAESMDEVVGKYIYVTHSQAKIHKIEPIINSEGKSFDITKWQDWAKTRNDCCSHTGSEMDALDFS